MQNIKKFSQTTSNKNKHTRKNIPENILILYIFIYLYISINDNYHKQMYYYTKFNVFKNLKKSILRVRKKTSFPPYLSLDIINCTGEKLR